MPTQQKPNSGRAVARKLCSLRDDASGVTAIEYALIAGVVSVALFVAVGATGEAVRALWGFIATKAGACMRDPQSCG